MTIYPEISYFYSPIETQILLFPIRLYIKQCPHCNMMYFGKTKEDNIENYNGSGLYWKDHLKTHNVKPITLMVTEWFFDKTIVDIAVTFSLENNIVESDLWANMCIENGIDGGYLGEKIVNKMKMTKNDQQWKETIGKAASRKIVEATDWVELGRKISGTKNNPLWKETIGRTARKKQVANTDYKEVGRKGSETKQDPKWKETTGVNVAKRSSELQKDQKWREEKYILCEHCNKSYSPGMFKRWHGNNCKMKK